MIETIPLNKLVRSPRNVRKHADPAADAELKASIAACGLLQNLIVRPAAKGRFEVDAGERRRRAMFALAEEKALPRNHPVTCLVLDDLQRGLRREPGGELPPPGDEPCRRGRGIRVAGRGRGSA